MRVFQTDAVRSECVERLRELTCGRVIRFEPRQEIYRCGGHLHQMYFIVSGTVSLRVTDRSGKSAILATLGDGDFFGEDCMDNGGSSACGESAMTIDGAILIRIDKTSMRAALAADKELAVFFMNQLLTKAQRSQDQVMGFLFDSCEIRLARILLELAQPVVSGGVKQKLPRVTHDDLAQMVGTTRSRVTFFMGRFRTQGIVTGHGPLMLNRGQMLAQFSPHV